MLHRPRVFVLGLLVASAGLGAAAVPAGAYSEYKTVATGKWKVQDKFDETAGGSMTVDKKGKRAKNLKVTIGAEADVETCGTGTVQVAKKPTIKRVGSYQRPVVGKLKGGLIVPVSAPITANGTTQQGTVMVIFEKDGKTGFTAQIKFGECQLDFAVRK